MWRRWSIRATSLALMAFAKCEKRWCGPLLIAPTDQERSRVLDPTLSELQFRIE